jgi:hypothetical protein
MEPEDAEEDRQVLRPREPHPDDIRVNVLTFNRHMWPYSFNMPFIEDGGRNLASVGAYYIPAEFSELDGICEAMCVKTHEPLILLGYMFRNGIFLDPMDERVLIGKEVYHESA